MLQSTLIQLGCPRILWYGFKVDQQLSWMPWRKEWKDDDEMYLQNAGCLTGLCYIICAVERITTNPWDARWKELLNHNDVRMIAADRYMDDIRSFMKSLRLGWRWHPAQRDMPTPYLQDVGEDSSDGKLPSLETTIWVELNRIMFEFFSKPIANILEVQATSALGEEWRKTKLSSLAEEVKRMMRNTRRNIEHSRRLNTLD